MTEFTHRGTTVFADGKAVAACSTPDFAHRVAFLLTHEDKGLETSRIVNARLLNKVARLQGKPVHEGEESRGHE